MDRRRPPKRPKLRWDRSMREALCCLYRFFQCDKRQKEEIFFFIFRDNLRRRDIHSFVPFGTLHAQWIWMRNTGDLVWARVHKETVFDMEGEWKDIIQRIKSTAATLRLHIREKAEDNIDTALWGTRAIVSCPIVRSSEPVIVNVQPATTPPPISLPERLHRVPSPYRPEEQETSHWFVSSVDQSDRSSTIHDGHSEDQTDHLGSSQSTVNSHGKLCIWCEQGTRIEQPNDYNDQGQHNHIEIIDNHDHSQEAEEQDQERQDRDHQLHDQDQQSYNGEGHHLNHDMAMQGVLAKDLPPLLYRWSNPDSQGVNSKTYYRAALFCNGEWFNPEDFSESRFLKYFRSHVSKEKTKTPFISTFRSPLAPIHRALANRNGAVVTVIDTSKLNTKVFYTAPLAVRTGIVALWRGYGEYLIWGHIPTEAIAFTVEITSLEDIANSHRDINRLMQIPLISNVKYCNYNLRDMLASRRKSPFKSGRTLGKLLTLLQVPMVYWDSISYRFARTWGWRCGEEITQFCSGLRSGEPYFAEELSDSEREVPLSTPLRRHRRTPSKNIPSIDFDSDLDYEPPETDEGSEGTSDSDGPNDSRSVSMCDKTETVDDENFSTHETLSSGIFPQDNGPDDLPEQPNTEDMMDGTSDDEDTCSQRALQRDWPSDDGTHPDTPTPMEMRIPRLFEDGPTLQVDFGGQMNMDLAERVRLWYHHENGSNM